MEAAVTLTGGAGTLLDIASLYCFPRFPFHTGSSQFMESTPQPGLEQVRTTIWDGRFRPILLKAEHIPEIARNSGDPTASTDMIGHIPDIYSEAYKVHGGLGAEGTQFTNMPDMAYAKRRLPCLRARSLSISHHCEGLCSDVLLDSGHCHHFALPILTLLLKNAAFRVIKRNGYGDSGESIE